MDLIEITYHDYLAECAEIINFDNWFINDWENYVLTYYQQPKRKKDNHNAITINDTQFTLEDKHIELYEGVFEREPYTDIMPVIGGRLTTLVMLININVKDGKLKGKMCIRDIINSPIYTEYEICIKNIQLKMTVGLLICGDGLKYDHCKYDFPITDITFLYHSNAQMTSLFDKVQDINKRKLLEQFVLEYITKDLCSALEDFQQMRLSIKQSVSELCGNDYSLRNMLRIHNRKVHTAFNNLSKKIICITNSLLDKVSPTLTLSKLFGFSNIKIAEKTLKVFNGILSNLNSMKMEDTNDVIISNVDDLLVLHVPIGFEKLSLHCKELSNNEADKTQNEENQDYSITTEGAYFIISLKKLTSNKVEFNLLKFKIKNFKYLTESNVKITLDYLLSFAIQEQIKPCLEQALTSEELHELAINPEIEIEYYGDEFETEDSEYED